MVHRRVMSILRKVTNFMENRGQALFNRSTMANFMMMSFILLTTVGAGMVYLPAGLITAGVTCGLFGYLLGSE